jgi:hypothetical protein
MNAPARGLALLLLLAVTAAAAQARADDEDDQTEAMEGVGKELYVAARKARVANDFATCHAKASAAWATYPFPPVAALIGDCGIELERYREAAERLSFAIAAARNVKPALIERWKERLAEATKHVATVEVSVSVDGAACTVDDAALDKLPATLYLDPGPHTITATAPQHTADERKLVLGAGTTQKVELAPRPLHAAPDPVPGPRPIGGDENESGPPVYALAAIAPAAVALAGFGVAIWAAVSHGETSDDVDALSAEITGNACASPTPPAQCGSLREGIDDLGTYAIAFPVGLAVGAAATAVTATLLILQFTSDDGAAETRLSVNPVLGTIHLEHRF